MAKKTGADIVLALLDEVRSMQKSHVEMQKSHVEMQKLQAQMQREMQAFGAGLNRAARLIGALADVTGEGQRRLENHETRLRALEQRH